MVAHKRKRGTTVRIFPNIRLVPVNHYIKDSIYDLGKYVRNGKRIRVRKR